MFNLHPDLQNTTLNYTTLKLTTISAFLFPSFLFPFALKVYQVKWSYRGTFGDVCTFGTSHVALWSHSKDTAHSDGIPNLFYKSQQKYLVPISRFCSLTTNILERQVTPCRKNMHFQSSSLLRHWHT